MIGIIALVGTASGSVAQDLSPVIDPAQVAQGQVLSDMVRNHGRAAAVRRGARGTPAQIAGCRQKARFQREHGADDPKVRQLYRLCRGIGL